MDDATVDADLFGDPSSNAFIDHLLGNEEALVEEAAAAAAERRRTSGTRDPLSEPEWRTLRRIRQTDASALIDLRSLDHIEEVDENLHCPICHSPLISPVKLKCDHVFCDECVRNALDHQDGSSKTCPSCRGRTELSSISPVTKIVIRILDDLKVRCPLRDKGCREILPRGGIQDHADLYCGWAETDCSSHACSMKVQRRFGDGPCLHKMTTCPNCSLEMMELELEHHKHNSCESSYTECLDCGEWTSLSKALDHASMCPEAIITCPASGYGCDFASKRCALDSHLSTCPLAKIAPFLAIQKSRLDEHEAALSHLRRKLTLYEDGLASIQDTLHGSIEDPSSAAQNSGSHSHLDTTNSHLLDLHESLQTDILHVKNSVAELDAKMEMTVLNQNLRANEESLHRDAVEGKMQRQIHWLLSSRLQSQQRTQGFVRAGSETASNRTGLNPGGGAALEGREASTSSAGKANVTLPPRRMSDGGRQETKL